jgi:hypothetical protein
MLVLVFSQACWASAEGPSVKSTHFEVWYEGEPAFARQVSVEAERLYEQAARDLGFVRRGGFRLWERRVAIRIYADADAFHRAGAPEWAAGKAAPERNELATYRAALRPDRTVLAHELGHFILRDFFGADHRPPLWLDEGFAQWQERRQAGVHGLMRGRLAAGEVMALPALMRVDARALRGLEGLDLFYLQAASLVGYLIGEWSPERFRKLCGQLRDGKSLDEALRFTYPETWRSMGLLEKAWRDSLAAPAGRH